jgi:hypothetical protein
MIVIAYNATPEFSPSITTTPGTGVSLFLTLTQILGVQGAKTYLENLKSGVNQRAEDIVISGAGVSKKGVVRMLKSQVEQFGDQEGELDS